MTFRYAVVTGEAGLSAWEYACVEKINATGHAVLAGAVRLREDVDRPMPVSSDAFRSIWDEFYTEANRPAGNDGAELIPTALQTATQAADAIARMAADVVLAFCSRERIARLRSSGWRVWHFMHGDVDHFESSLPGFWEIYHRYDVTAAAMLEFVAPGRMAVLQAGRLATKHTSLLANVRAAYGLVAELGAAAFRSAAVDGTLAERPAIEVPTKRYGLPRDNEIREVRRILDRNRRKHYWHSMLSTIDWNLAALMQQPDSLMQSGKRPRIKLLRRPQPGCYLADPCTFVHDNRTFMFCELYLHAQERGVITAFEIVAGEASPLGVMIAEPHHLSYPQLISYKGDVLCMPESAAARCINIYRARTFPHAWEKVHTFLEGFAAVDPTLLNLDGKWWLFCTNGDQGYNSHLYVWHADDLFGEWKPHLKNPVKIDVRSAGPAGPFFLSGDHIIRPAQDCSRTYGGRLVMNRLAALTDREFSEEAIAIIEPPEHGYTKGIHCISSTAELSVVDVKRYLFRPAGINRALKTGLKSAARRAGITDSRLVALRRLFGNRAYMP